MRRKWIIAAVVVALAALGAVEGLRALQRAKRPAEARLVERAVAEGRQSSDPVIRAALEAQAAKLYVRWNRRQARRWAQEAVATFPAKGVAVPARDEDSLTDTIQQAVTDLERAMMLTDVAAVDPQLALRAVATVGDQDLRQSITTSIALAAAKTDPGLCRSLSKSIHDPGARASVALARLAAQGRPPKAALWREVEPFVRPIEQTKEPRRRAQSLALMGILARRLGHPEVWEQRLLPAFRATLQSVQEPDDLGWIAHDCLPSVVRYDPSLAGVLTDEIRRALLHRNLPPGERDYVLLKTLAFAKPEEAVRLISKRPPGLPRATSLLAVMMGMPDGHQEAAAAACELMKKDLQRPLSPTFQEMALRQLARFEPDQALALGRRRKADAARVVQAAAPHQPDWALAHLDLVPKPEDRARVVLAAVSARLDKSPPSHPGARRR